MKKKSTAKLPARKLQVHADDESIFHLEKIERRNKSHPPQYRIVDDRQHIVAHVWNEAAAEIFLLGSLVRRIARREIEEQLKTHKRQVQDAFR